MNIIEIIVLPLFDNSKALEVLQKKIEQVVVASGIPKDKFVGIGIGMPGFVDVKKGSPDKEKSFSEHMACHECELSFEELEPRSFSFNSPFGACPECTGIGTKLEVDEELIIPDDSLSIDDGAIAPWSGGQSSEYFSRLLEGLAKELKFSLSTPWKKLSAKSKDAILNGWDYEVHVKYKNRYGRVRNYSTGFEGVTSFIERQTRVLHTDLRFQQAFLSAE